MTDNECCVIPQAKNLFIKSLLHKNTRCTGERYRSKYGHPSGTLFFHNGSSTSRISLCTSCQLDHATSSVTLTCMTASSETRYLSTYGIATRSG